MNKLESDYSFQLAMRRDAGDIANFCFESVTLKIADGVRYNPDFMVITADGEVEFHECKGFMRDDARVKLRVAARVFPWFRFVLVKRGAGRMVFECTEVAP